MIRLFEKIIQRRNPNFKFDASISFGMVIEFVCDQFFRMLRGIRTVFFLKNPKAILLGNGVRMRYISKINWGKFVKIDDHVLLSALGKDGISIGDNSGIGAFSRLIVSTTWNNPGAYIKIGKSVGIGEYAYLGGAGGLEIGDECIIGQYFSCHPENHIFENTDVSIRHQGTIRKGIKIGNNCWIGSKVSVLDGVEIGEGSVVAAGSVVNKSFPAGSVIGGVPAKLLKSRFQTEKQELINRIA
jgi:acetyltransferase-like isoleucine patch superfamily enzyme